MWSIELKSNSEPQVIIRVFWVHFVGAIELAVTENPIKHPKTQALLFLRELGSSEFNLFISDNSNCKKLQKSQISLWVCFEPLMLPCKILELNSV